jgi:hypothetical protein
VAHLFDSIRLTQDSEAGDEQVPGQLGDSP